nr:MAG: hypothetical protein [Microvirus sp.]
MAYKFITLQEYKSDEGYTPDQKMLSKTEQAGYRSIKSEIEELMQAGERAMEWRRQAFPAGSQDIIMPVYVDKLDALEMQKQARAEIDKVNEAGNAELARLAEAERAQLKKDKEELEQFRKQQVKKPVEGEPEN